MTTKQSKHSNTSRETRDADELRESWNALEAVERIEVFRELDREEAIDFFLSSSSHGQAQIIDELPREQKRLWLRLLPPDDAADVLQEVGSETRRTWLELLDGSTRHEVAALLTYAREEAGGLMNPRFAQVRPEMRVDEAIRYLREQVRQHLETIYYVYVIDDQQCLQGVVSFRELFEARSSVSIREIMIEDVIAVPENMDQEEVAQLFDVHDLIALPVVDDNDHIQGIVTFDDIVDVVREEATEDVQKIGGMEALETPYLDTSFWSMIRKRAVWLIVLFFGLLLTASAIELFEAALAEVVALSIFIPMIIASGGNSGAQAATLVVRSLAVDDLRGRDWAQVLGRELLAGLALGGMLAILGYTRVLSWWWLFGTYGEHASLIGLTVGLSLVGVVTWATLVGSLLPFALEALGFDSANASVPLLSTLVDVTGIIIYFNVAKLVLGGTLL